MGTQDIIDFGTRFWDQNARPSRREAATHLGHKGTGVEGGVTAVAVHHVL